MASLKKNILGGVFWTGLEAVVNRGFDFIIQLLLAKLLFPEDYGIVGMAAVFIALLEVMNDLGFGAALVQKKKELLTPAHFDTAFWTGIGWAISMFLGIYFVFTPLIAAFYDVEILNNIIPAMALTILVRPINTVHRAQLVKRLAFKKIAIINSISNFIAGATALTLAFLDFGIWALVFYAVTKAVFAVPLYFNATKWTPSFRWSKEAFTMLFGFGIFTLGTSIANVFSQKIDYLLVGKFVGATALGFYTFAFLLTQMLRTQIVRILNKVLFPIYAQLQDDPKRLIKLYLQVLSANNLIVYPLMVGFFLFAEYAIPLFFGDKWNGSILLIKILCISGCIQMIINSNQALFRAYGKVKLEFLLQLGKTFFFFVPLLLIGVYYYGAVGAAVGFTLATFLSACLTLFYLWKTFGMTLIDLFRALRTSLFMSLFCTTTTLLLLQYFPWYFCVIYYLVAVICIYVLLAKQEVQFLISLIKKRKKAE